MIFTFKSEIFTFKWKFFISHENLYTSVLTSETKFCFKLGGELNLYLNLYVFHTGWKIEILKGSPQDSPCWMKSKKFIKIYF